MNECEGNLRFKFFVIRFNSIAKANPMIVTARAVSFRWRGIVVWGVFIGKMLLVRKNPAKMLPSVRRLIELISKGLFSLMGVEVVNRGCPSRA